MRLKRTSDPRGIVRVQQLYTEMRGKVKGERRKGERVKGRKGERVKGERAKEKGERGKFLLRLGATERQPARGGSPVGAIVLAETFLQAGLFDIDDVQVDQHGQ